ncbi:MAG: permease-like cell division protein FtsX [Acidimicrobiales bacterium]
MALRVEYLVRETGNNLRRNVALTIPAVLTVAVSLALFGVSLLLGGGADRFTQQWRGGIEFIVFMNPDASQDQIDLIQNAVTTSPEVKKWTYFDKAKAFEEFRELFKDKPDLVNSVTPDILPPSYRIVPQNPDADAVTALAAQFENQPGVKQVRKATDVIKDVESLTRYIKIGLWVTSIVLFAVSLLLILNTIFTAMTARRREIEVMKLVGATNWFIRVPFMLEGLIQGVSGAIVAVIATSVFNGQVFPRIQRLEILKDFRVDSGQLWTTSIWLIVLGCVIGVVGSLFGVSRYLDV